MPEQPHWTDPRTPSQLRATLARIQQTSNTISGDVGDLTDVATVAAAPFGTDDVLIASDGTVRGVKATSIDKDTVVIASVAFGTDGLILLSDGTGRSVQVQAAGTALEALGDPILIGDSAGAGGATFGNFNVGVGSQAMNGATISDGNTAIGRNAFAGATMASSNVGIGTNAGNALDDAGNLQNTFIGNGAGATSTSQAADVDRSTAIGDGAFTTMDDQLMLGSTNVVQTIMRGTVDVVRSTNACAVNVYNTSGDDPPDTDYERLAIQWDSDVARIETQAGAGGGTDRDLSLGSASTPRLTLHADGLITLDTVGNLPTSEPTSGGAGQLWLQNDGGSANSAFLMVTTS